MVSARLLFCIFYALPLFLFTNDTDCLSHGINMIMDNTMIIMMMIMSKKKERRHFDCFPHLNSCCTSLNQVACVPALCSGNCSEYQCLYLSLGLNRYLEFIPLV